MELPDVGHQCSELHCKQLDFLPLKCQCGIRLCSEHFNQHSVNCVVLQKANITNLESTRANYVCSYSNCDSRSYLPLLCDKCNKHFCITHRHLNNCGNKIVYVAAEIKRFQAPVKMFEDAKAVIDKQLDNNISLAKKKIRTENLASKVQLMRIKNKATGLKTVLVTDRTYFNITLPSVKGSKEFPVYVSKQWSLGKVIDAIADECKVTNKNNQSTGSKLRLFHKSSGEIVFTNLSVKLEELLLNKDVFDGEDLVFEYVYEECTFLKQ